MTVIFLCLAALLVAYFAFSLGVIATSYRLTCEQAESWQIGNAYELAMTEPDKGLQAIAGILRRNEKHALANAIDFAGSSLVDWRHDEAERASTFHRRAQKAEGLLARRESDLTKARARASRMHRRAQKAEGALRRLKRKVISRRATGVLTAADYASFPPDFVAYHTGQYEVQAREVLEHIAAKPCCHSIYLDDAAPPEDPPIECTKPNHHEGDHEGVSPNGHVTWPKKGFDRLLDRIRVEPTTLGIAGTFDVVPAAKPLSDVTPKRTVTAMPGLDLSGLTGTPMCHATIPSGLLNHEPVACTRESGHEGPHSSGANGSRVEWGFFMPTKPAEPAVKPDFSGGVLEAMSAAMNECTACGGTLTEACICGKEPLRCVCHPCDCKAKGDE